MSVARGRNGEDLAEAYLCRQGLQIIGRNWRNRWCEIDIIASADDGLRFVEVKYRKSQNYGSPVDYITYEKANRLRRACLAWVQAHQYQGQYQIDVISVIGDLADPQIEWLENAVTD